MLILLNPKQTHPHSEPIGPNCLIVENFLNWKFQHHTHLDKGGNSIIPIQEIMKRGFRMTGTVTVVDEGNRGSTPAANFDTVGTLMVPSEDSLEMLKD